MTLFFSLLTITAISLLWRLYQQDSDNPLHTKVRSLPYLLQKPLVCGTCFTFWVALVFNIIFKPLQSFLPMLRFELGMTLSSIIEFLSSWMILGMGAAFILYIYLTFFEVSHYYAHKAHESKSHE